MRREKVDGLLIHDALLADRLICLVEGGMGAEAASRAAALLIKARRPRLLLSAGFCGAIRTGSIVGDTIICDRLLTLNAEGLSAPPPPEGSPSAAHLTSTLRSHGITALAGSFITTDRIVSKPELAQKLPHDLPTPVLEMESAAVAAAAAAAHLPFLGFRTVSDDAAEELLFSLDELTTANRISIPKVLMLCLTHPRTIPQLARLAANSAVAGKNLGLACRLLLPLLDSAGTSRP
ncbi:5'-methylthioadenosine nucleosidase [Trichlorobacter ammonificans]|uniref:5'-methylthioadenosine nucleosidase n=1 Tax=Trichlorobacter ammonificans TaxID=2916410 RepID=A0ABN8HGJ7_9BACT|nr:5'-methylthioadenosine nucleosidase [Trichlorobacter ammonificans]